MTVNSITGLLQSLMNHDSACVIFNYLTNTACFTPILMTYSLDRLAELYVQHIVRLHGVPKSIISNRDSRFTTNFWGSLQSALGTKLKFSSAYHPQTDGQSERTIQTLEDMLRACAIDFSGSWEKYLPLVEFAYNNSFQATIGMAPYEALYGRQCRSPVHWDEAGERRYLGPEMVDEATEAIRKIQKRMKAA